MNNRIIDGKRYINQTELAERWGMSREAVSKRAAQPDFPKHKWIMGRSKLYAVDEIERYEEKDPALAERLENKDALNRP